MSYVNRPGNVSEIIESKIIDTPIRTNVMTQKMIEINQAYPFCRINLGYIKIEKIT